MMFYSIFGFLYYLLALGSCSQNNGDCRTLAFKTIIEGSALNGHVVKSYVVKSQGDCELKCYLEDECMSINFGPEHSGTYLCELSDSDHGLHPKDLRHRDGFIYRATENVCVNNPCSSNGRCQTGFTDKGFLCVCYEGFTAEDCSKEKQTTPQPGISCLHIMQSGNSVGDGEYLIDPENDGNPLKVHCDMSTDGGGWLLVANLVMNSSLPSTLWTAAENYQEIRNYFNNRMGLSRTTMKHLRRRLSFTQLRFYCRKQQRRTFHVITAANSTGEAVVQYFSGETDVQPDACGSFVRMEDDNSQLASSCHLWGNMYRGKWGMESNKFQQQMYRYAAFIRHEHNWLIIPSSDGRQQCDDNTNDVSTGDFWKIFVR